MERRKLRFAALPDAVAEGRALLTRGYAPLGKWSLGQIGAHLALAIEQSLDGFPWVLPWPITALIRWWALGTVLRHEPMRRTVAVPKFLRPPDGIGDEEGWSRFEAAAARFAAHQGELHPSPIFGRLTREQWREAHLWHSEHHLSFLLPR